MNKQEFLTEIGRRLEGFPPEEIERSKAYFLEMIEDRMEDGMSEEEDFFVDGKLLFDLGIQYRYKQIFQLSLDCENIFDTYHYICGPSYDYMPDFQKGRMLMASVSYRF